jgi:hypothetical protein
MATEYHLLTCLGRDGLTITAATSDVITLAAHGMRAGHPVRFTNIGGSLPGGLAANTTYYVSATDLLAGSFKVSATNGGSVVDITSTGSGTNKVIGAYWATLPATDPGNGGNYKARYGSAGSERVWSTWALFEAAIRGRFDTGTDLILEIQGAWTDTSNYGTALKGFKSITVHTKINGVRDPDAWHYGDVTKGWTFSAAAGSNGPAFAQPNVIVDGIASISRGATTSTRSAIGGSGACVGMIVRNCILKNYYGVGGPGTGHQVYNNIIYDCDYAGIAEVIDILNGLIAFNLISGCAIGISSAFTTASRPMYSAHIGNILIGNTLNYGKANQTAIASSRYIALYNTGDANDIKTVTFTAATNLVNFVAHGLTLNTPLKFTNTGGALPGGLVSNTTYYIRTVNTDSFTLSSTIGGAADVDITTDGTGSTTTSLIWDTAPSGDPATSVICVTTDFIDYTNKDFRPASASSPQVELITLTDDDNLSRLDILDAVRPNYINATTDKADAGPYEFDHGNGLAPLTVSISISNIISGTVLAIYKSSDNSQIVAPTTVSGTSFSTTYTYTADTAVIVRLRKSSGSPKYLPQDLAGTITTSGLNITAMQVLDTIA